MRVPRVMLGHKRAASRVLLNLNNPAARSRFSTSFFLTFPTLSQYPASPNFHLVNFHLINFHLIKGTD